MFCCEQRTDSLLGEEEDAHALAAGRPSTGIVLPEGQGLENHFFLSHKQQNGGQTMAWLESKLAHRDLSAWYDNAMEDRSVSRAIVAGIWVAFFQKSASNHRCEQEAGMLVGVQSAAVFVLFLTAGSLERYFVQLEMQAAFRLRKPILLLHETDERYGKPNFRDERAAVVQLGRDGKPLVTQAQLGWIFDEVVGIPIRREAHEVVAMLDEIELHARKVLEDLPAKAKRPPEELCRGAPTDDGTLVSMPSNSWTTRAVAERPPVQWNVDALAAWLTAEMKQPEVAAEAVKQQVDGATAVEMDLDMWRELGAEGLAPARLKAGLAKKQAAPP